MIEVRDLVKRYGSHIAVDHLSFTVEKGQIYGFLGPNGAGKSTTMNIMTGYIGPTAGDVIINGHNILEEPEEAKRCIGYMPEQPPLYIDMTVCEYLNFAAELKGLQAEEQIVSVEKAMELTCVKDVESRLIRNLSKGYRQRVGLAQAILGFPKIIILDEPTVGLDPKQIIEIRDLIRSLKGEHTVILSSHILSEVQEICDHVMIIHHGKLVASGTPSDLEKKMKTSALELTLKAESTEQVEVTFADLSGISNLICFKKPGLCEVSVKLEMDKDRDPREAIYNACAEAKLPILMMKSAELSLEQIFLEITSDEAVHDSTEKNEAIEEKEGKQ